MWPVMCASRRSLAGALALVMLTLGSPAWATPMVTFTAAGLAGGVFRYDLTLSNQGGSEPLSGLLVLNGGSVFVLDNTSVIRAPAERCWKRR